MKSHLDILLASKAGIVIWFTAMFNVSLYMALHAIDVFSRGSENNE